VRGTGVRIPISPPNK